MSFKNETFQNKARTKIIATVGPACRQPDQLTQLVRSGVDLFRINLAHTPTEQAEKIIEDIDAVSRQLGEPIAILADLPGPKIRLGELPSGLLHCKKDELYEFVRGETVSSPNQLTCTYPLLIDEVQQGDTLMLADGTVSMTAERKEADSLFCRVVQPGEIRSRQGVNLPGVKLSVATLGEEDRALAIWAARADIDYLGLSFVRSAAEVQQTRSLLTKHNSNIGIIAKIEKREALEQLEEIVEAADGIMVARGDLGVEIDVARMPIEQKRIIRTCHQRQRPVIIATQMLDSMEDSSRPTRAETTDVANAILDGGDACMLSGETAIGKYPREAVEMMNRIAKATEEHLSHMPLGPFAEHRVAGLHAITNAVVHGSSWIAHELKAKLVVVASHSGATSLALAKMRSSIPTIGVSDQEKTLRKMCLYWGVTPVMQVESKDLGQLTRTVENWGQEIGCLASGDKIVFVAGSSILASAHDMVLVHEVE